MVLNFPKILLPFFFKKLTQPPPLPDSPSVPGPPGCPGFPGGPGGPPSPGGPGGPGCELPCEFDQFVPKYLFSPITHRLSRLAGLSRAAGRSRWAGRTWRSTA